MRIIRVKFVAATVMLLTIWALTSSHGWLVPAARAGDRCSPGAPMVDESEAGLPVYPGLEYMGRGKGGDMTVNDAPTLPTLAGCTFDSVDEVVDFYARELSGWSRIEHYGTQYFFKKDPGKDFNPLAPEVGTLSHVAVIPPFQEGRPVLVNYTYEQ